MVIGSICIAESDFFSSHARDMVDITSLLCGWTSNKSQYCKLFPLNMINLSIKKMWERRTCYLVHQRYNAEKAVRAVRCLGRRWRHLVLLSQQTFEVLEHWFLDFRKSCSFTFSLEFSNSSWPLKSVNTDTWAISNHYVFYFTRLKGGLCLLVRS